MLFFPFPSFPQAGDMRSEIAEAKKPRVRICPRTRLPSPAVTRAHSHPRAHGLCARLGRMRLVLG